VRAAVIAGALLLTTAAAFAQPAKTEESVRDLLQRARGQSAAGDAAGALDSLRRARTIAPNSEDVLSAIAQVSLAARAPLPAIEVLDPLTRICPTVPQYHYLFGVALMQAGDLVTAVEMLETANRLEADNELTLVALGLALNGRLRYAEAEPHLRRSLELQPGNLEATAALAEAQEGMSHLDEAEALAGRVLQSIDTHATANLVVGLVRMKQGRYADARDALLKAIAANPQSPRAHYQLSLAYARLGDEASSQKYLALYQQKQRELQDTANAVRSRTGS
jgi:tetratricopeptide (TPR) repeat protein